MARKKKNSGSGGSPTLNLVVNGSGNATIDRETDAEELESIDDLEDGQLFRAMDEVRQVEGAKAEVYRVAPADKIGHCRSYPVSVFSLEKVRADHGPGKYRVRFKGPGDKYIKGGSTFDIAEGLNDAAPASSATGAVETVLALFKAEREREEADRAKKTSQWWEVAKLCLPLALPKILEMIGGGRNLGPRDLLGMMKDMKDLQAPAADLNTQFQTVLSVLQGAKELVGDGEKVGSTWVDLLRDFLGSPAAGALASAIPGMIPRPPALPPRLPPTGSTSPVTAAPQVPAGSSESAASTAAPSGSPDVFQQLNWLRATLVSLLAQAHKGANPRLYGEVVLDNLPPFIKDKDLLDRLNAPDWFAQLQQIEPHVAPHAEWFQKFRDYVVRALTRRLRKGEEMGAPPAPPPNAPLPDLNQPMQEEEQYE
jgi:hypothetical protein